MSLTTLLAAILVGVLAPALAACGGAGSSGPLTQAQLVAKSNAICGPLNAHITTTEDDTVPYLASHGPILYKWERAALGELEKIVPPRNFADDWATVLTGLRTLAEHTERAARMAIHSKAKTTFNFLSIEQYVGERAAATAERDGWHQCAHVTRWRNI